MSFSEADHQYMTLALSLAAAGRFTTDPNPNVGAVLVKNAQVIGQGYHRQAGQGHAEVYALQQAGSAAAGATCYVTLEPCAHYGRTPPCAEALVKAGVSRVVIAMLDPNPLVAGKGVAILESA
ncbi:bifunctional diaminohydroxyphosphoribosylaminopyrimidine deaminase/5-amino-6-(5-phosphoribosylamino)uracil reductase RibD, partial [Alishewanella sp. SMS9]|nr:bifunctional diaminohydroxyphosphoribosylaminopyrimidine deaminase/5-amino-6-(5-phosphoribosylamino)uracil reductase RibD [Alishewanella sp. SMS9]